MDYVHQAEGATEDGDGEYEGARDQLDRARELGQAMPKILAPLPECAEIHPVDTLLTRLCSINWAEEIVGDLNGLIHKILGPIARLEDDEAYLGEGQRMPGEGRRQAAQAHSEPAAREAVGDIHWKARRARHL